MKTDDDRITWEEAEKLDEDEIKERKRWSARRVEDKKRTRARIKAKRKLGRKIAKRGDGTRSRRQW